MLSFLDVAKNFSKTFIYICIRIRTESEVIYLDFTKTDHHDNSDLELDETTFYWLKNRHKKIILA